MAKYWIANNPNAEVTDAQCVALKNLSTADLSEIEAAIAEWPVAAETAVATYAEADIDSDAELVVVINALGSKINSIIDKLETAGIFTAN